MNAQGVYELEWVLGTERVYGCDEEEYRRRGWQSFHVSDGWEAASMERTRRYLAGETVEFTVPIRRADGHIRWVEVKNRPIADPATGKFTRLVGVAVDITERKQAADALRESEFRYRTVAELTSGFVYEATRRCRRRSADRLGQSGPGDLFRRPVSKSSTASAGATCFSRPITPPPSSAASACAWVNVPRSNWP